MRPEVREKLSQSLKAKWASGTRRKNPPETYEKASRTHREQYRLGIRVPPVLDPERAREMVKLRDHEKMIEINRRIGEQRRGIPNPPGPSAKGPGHWKARYWKLRAPTGELIEGWNLNELVRRHAHLFDPADLNWKNSRCRASKGLRLLYETDERGHTHVHSWKGWTARRVNDDGLEAGGLRK